MPVNNQSISGRRVEAGLCGGLILFFLSGCTPVQTITSVGKPAAKSTEVAASSWLPRTPAAGFILPAGVFDKPVAFVDPPQNSTSTVPLVSSGVFDGPAVTRAIEVFLYASPTTQKYLASGGVDGKFPGRLWETFLRKYKIPYRIVQSIEQLAGLPSGVLLLPSTVALSEQERQAIKDFREKGGGCARHLVDRGSGRERGVAWV